MRWFAADLHIHTALSPCAEDAMTPPAIVIAAMDAGLDIIAICDHNAAANIEAVREVAEGPGEGRVAVLAGMEITTAEEVHLVCLFPEPDAALATAAKVREGLPRYAAGARRYGRQLIMNGDGDIVGEEDAMLSSASALPIEAAAALVRENAGIVIAAHVDRPSFSIFSQLGFLPPNLPIDALEVSAAGYRQGRAVEFEATGLPLVTASDSHSYTEVGCVHTDFRMESPGFVEIARALKGLEGRDCRFA